MTVYVVLPNKARDFTEYEGLKTKTDSMDGRPLSGAARLCLPQSQAVESSKASLLGTPQHDALRL